MARPTPYEWYTALRDLRNELSVCSNVSHHQYYKALSICPWCEVNSNFAQSSKRTIQLTQTTIPPQVNTPVPKVIAPPSPPPPPPPSPSQTPSPPLSPAGSPKAKSSIFTLIYIFGIGRFLAWIFAVRSAIILSLPLLFAPETGASADLLFVIGLNIIPFLVIFYGDGAK